MLTRQDRHEIAERAKACKKEEELNWDQFSYVLLGIQSWRNDDELLDRIIDLCDTSNMVELPVDKDGEVIRIRDVVYDNTGMEWEVREFRFPLDGACIYARTDNDYSTFRPDELAHKTTTIEENIEEFNKAVKAIAQYVEASMNKCVEAMKKLAEVFNSLGDSDD
jgi:hypothetical protein